MTNIFSFEKLVEAIKAAQTNDNPEAAISDVLQQAIRNPDAIFAATPQGAEEETCHYEDDRLSIWSCRFHPNVMMPPHEHCLKVLIGTYSGAEKSVLYKRTDDGLKETGTITAETGEVIVLDKEAIHAVTAAGGCPSDAIHVYLGPLMQLERDLFDWDSGAVVPFTMDNFEAMKKAI